jgi:hypothetical protein
MKRYDIDIETTYGRGMYDGDEYSTLRIREGENGEWVKASEAEKMKDQIYRMQKRIDALEGRS